MNRSKISQLLEIITSTIESPQFAQLSLIEQDLLLQHLRELYDELATMKQQPQADTPPLKPELSENETIQLKQPVKININKSLLMEEISPATPTIVPKTEAITNPHPQETQPVTMVSSINERTPSNTTINQKVQNGAGKEIHKTFTVKPLRELIDFNKKFAMVNELFRGNTESFNQAVNQIDAFENIEAAEQFIESELVSKNQWNTNSQTSRMFFKLVKQRFGQS